MINNKTLKTLEFDQILRMLSECTTFEESAVLAYQIIPKTDFKNAEKSLKLTSLARQLASTYNYPGFINMVNCDNALRRADLGSSLTLKNFLNINLILKNIRIADNFCRNIEDKIFYKDFIDLFEIIRPNKSLENKIEISIESEDKVSDNASSELKEIRRKINNVESKVRSTLDNIIHSSTYSKYLQDALITMRGDRFVVPVKSEFRAEVKGLVHDTSGSGATYFIEPMQVVELNNEIRILKNKEEQEIERILINLSKEVASCAEIIKLGYKALLDIDLIFSKARLADKMNASLPLLLNNGETVLNKARHPLIDKEKVVPINIFIGKDNDTLIITGPNTGGKTVAIKTIGLLTVMAQSGMYIPAKDDSKVNVYGKIFTDIGDEQSIEMSLSTFSSHMTNIVSIEKETDNNTLLLLDELCSGTDPIEGAALSIAILERFREKKAHIIATTHYAELKIYALETPGVMNASCEFDITTLSPTYKIIIGIPGKSNAFEISKRLGLPSEIIDKAKDNLSNAGANFEHVISELQNTRLELDKLKEAAEIDRNNAATILKEANSKLDSINKTREKELESVKNQARRILEQTRLKSDEILNELENIKKEKNIDEFNKRLNNARINLKTNINKTEDIFNPVVKNERLNKNTPINVSKGDIVYIHTLNKEGIVLSNPDNGKVYVQAGLIKTNVSINDIELGEKKKVLQQKGKGSRSGVASNATRSIKTELDLRGMDAETAIFELRNFIDSAILSNIPSIRIIHGKGTGILRSSVQNYLKKHKAIKTFRLGLYGEGEDGVTIAELK